MLKVVYKDDSVRVPNFSLQQILPGTEDYIKDITLSLFNLTIVHFL